MSFLSEYSLFLLKALTTVLSILFCVSGTLALSRKKPFSLEGELKIKSLNEQWQDWTNTLDKNILSKKVFKSKQKQSKKEKKSHALDLNIDQKKRIFVLDFKGDIRACQVETFRKLTSAILSVATDQDEVVIRLESPGGLVSHYGLAASQMTRFKTANIPLTVCIDRVAASGGYLMACVADKIVAAPFAIIGSIGVITATPNFHKLLKKNDIDYELFTSGQFKRTVTLFSETTKAGRQKKQAQIDTIHDAFKSFLKKNRPNVNLNEIATGEYWLASETLDLNLVDLLDTSDDYLFRYRQDKQIYHLAIDHPKRLIDKLLHKTENSFLSLFHPFKI